MQFFKDLLDITHSCTILCVDDDELVLGFLEDALSEFFKNVITAHDAFEALQKLAKYKVDLIITDYIMPNMTGIELIKEVKKSHQQIPTIVLTAFVDNSMMIEAINEGVTQILVKPIEYSTLLASVETAIQRVIVQRQKFLQQEAELLKYKEKLNTIQQKLTLKKQSNIIKDDLYYKMLETHIDGIINKWLINIRYKPHEILSGDFYTIRKISDDELMLYLADAMGKGLSAFVSVSIITAFLNYAVDKALQRNDFNKQRLLDDFLTFAKRYLVQDEAICALILFVNLKTETIDVANFAMPPVFVDFKDKPLLKIPQNNMPIMNFTANLHVDTFDIKGFTKLLMCSDGVYCDAYIDSIEEDFMSSPFRSTFNNKFAVKVPETDDDATFIFLKRLQFCITHLQSFNIKCRLQEVQSLMVDVELLLNSLQIDALFVAEFINAFSELIMNAYEHGSLGITYKQKNKLIKDGNYEEYLLEIENNFDKQISTSIFEFEDTGRRFIGCCIADEGEGFDTSIIKSSINEHELYHYRGIKIVKGLVNELYYNIKGNEVVFFKEIDS